MMQFRPYARQWRALAALLALLTVIIAAVTAAPAVELMPGQRAEVPGTEIVYLSDPDGTMDLDKALAAYDSGATQPVTTDVPDFGAVFDTFWLFVPVENIGDVPGVWSVYTRAPFFPAVTIRLRRTDGSLERVLDNSVDDPFAARPVRHRTVISAPFTLEPDERADLVIRFTAGGMSNFAFALESENSLSALLVEDAAVSGVFYAFSVAAILFFAVFSYAVRAWTGLLYSGLFAVSVLLSAQLDGLAFQFLWPDWPDWNGFAGISLLNVLCGIGFFVAARQRDSERPSPRFRRAAYGLAVLSIAVNALIPLVEPGIVVIIGYFLFVAMLAAQAAALLPGLRKPSGGIGNAALVAVVLVAVGSATLVALLFSGVPLPPLIGYNLHRIFYLVISLATMATLVGIVVQLRRDHESALEREVDAARRDAALNRDLFESEKNYARARDLAALRQRQLASATHDIKQPLASLRLSLDALAGDRDSGMRERLNEAFDYLEGLTGTYLAEARQDREAITDGSDRQTDEAERPDDPPERSEPYALSLITGTIDQMFREEAISKGLEFRCAGSDVQVTVPVLPLMRLFSNFVSNAVKYTEQGRVSVTSGAIDERAFLQVEDTGPGLSADALALYRQAGRKGERSQGEGLGLAIADDVAATLGVDIQVDSAPGSGTRFRVLLPAS